MKWEARVFEGDGLTSKILQTVGMHLCTDQEWAVGFHNPAHKDIKKLNDLRKNQLMMCLDSVDNKGVPVNKAIYGPDDGR